MSHEPNPAAVEFWEDRYAGAEQIWSGRVNKVLAEVAAGLAPGTALDLGCGEGGDAVWLAQQGWAVLGIDILVTAVTRAQRAAAEAGVDALARFVVGDLACVPDGSFDLVTASFLHAPVGVELPRANILRQAAQRVARGGHLLITGHAGFPPWADVPHGHEHHFLSPQEEVEQLQLDAGWEVVLAELRWRDATSPDGEPARLEDSIVLVRRRAAA